VIFVPIPRERIPQEWPRILSLIEPAIEFDKNATPAEVFDWLVTGHSEAFWIGVGSALGVGVTTTREGSCFINYTGGAVSGGPREFIRSCRAVVADIETLARDAGCTEVWGGGRNWSRVFPDWERPDPDNPNRFRKRLT